MPKAEGPKQQVRGGKRMKQRGRVRVEMWLDARENAGITNAAMRAGKPVATWIREQAFHAAEESAKEHVRNAKRDQAGD